MISTHEVLSTTHAVQRWVERFPGEGLAGLLGAFGRSRRVSMGVLVQWNRRTGRWSRFREGDDHFYDPVTEALFVVEEKLCGPVLVTVFRYRKPGQKRASR